MSEKNTNEGTTVTEIATQFSTIKSKYKKLGLNLTQALEIVLKTSHIHYLSINYRIKEETSFLEKIERKKYNDPFEEMEDICGIRIICYYQSDVEKIGKLISQELDVLDNQDKEVLLKPDQFGYRSTHFIAKIKDNWLEAPNYRGLESLKAEIQVRTILMHAWAEIEHKLAYKKETHIPHQFKRKLYRISAKLEEADEQFEELRNSIKDYRDNVAEIAKEIDNLQDVELNLDSLQAFLDEKFPKRARRPEQTSELLDEFLQFGITIKDFIEAFEKVKDHLRAIEKETFNPRVTEKSGWAQIGIVRTVLDLTHDEYFSSRQLEEQNKERKIKWRKIINASR